MSLEYAVDLYCKDSQAVSDLFFIFRRYTFVPFAKRVSMDGGKFYGWREPRKVNSVYKIHFGGKKKNKKYPRGKEKSKKYAPGKYVKIYERGEDIERIVVFPGIEGQSRRKFGWRHSDTDRVRFEVTINRKSGILAKHDIKTLQDLLFLGPQFTKILFPKSSCSTPNRRQDQLQFKNFVYRDSTGSRPRRYIRRNSKNLPNIYQDYITEDQQGNVESFMNEYFRGKNLKDNISRETEETSAFQRLQTKIIAATQAFDLHWQRTIKNQHSKTYNGKKLYTTLP